MYLVTGAAGFIGFHLSLRLLKHNQSVVGLDNINNYYNKKIKYDRLKILKKFGKFKFLKIDLNNKKNLESKIKKYKKKIEVIIHLAGQAGVRYSLINPIAYINDNILSYVHLLETFKNSKKIKLILYASSSSIYGENFSEVSLSTKTQNNPISIYSASKLTMELISKSYNAIHKLKFVGIRFFTVFGPWGRPDMFYFKLVKSIYKNKQINIFNFGNHKRSFTYIDDTIDNIIKIVNKFKSKKGNVCEVFNIGNPQSTNLKKFINIVEKKLNRKAKKKYIGRNIVEVIKTQANIHRERKIFSHKIKFNLNSGIEKFIAWYKTYNK